MEELEVDAVRDDMDVLGWYRLSHLVGFNNHGIHMARQPPTYAHHE
jgi:hypothetical protein